MRDYREFADNLVEEEQFVENYDDPAGEMQQLDSTDFNNVVESGDVAAQQTSQQDLNSVKGVRNRRIPNDKRTTTPYMTKYERARVLGTRALQIRWVLFMQTSRKQTASCRGMNEASAIVADPCL